MAIVADLITGPDHERQFGELLDRCFPVPSGSHFFDDFPVWSLLHDENVVRLGVFDDGKVVGSTAARLVQVKGLGKAAIIGAVAVDASYRGKGFASDLVKVAMDWAAERQAHYAFLWGSEDSLYGKLGFSWVGSQVRIPLAELPPGGVPGVHQGWDPGLWPLIRNRAGGLELTEMDRVWVEAQKNVKWFWLGTSDSPLAYAALGKGIDLPGIVHEWGGEIPSLRALLSAVYHQCEEAALLASPQAHERMLSAIFGEKAPFFISGNNEPLCMAARLQETAPRLPHDLWFWGLDGA